MIVLRSSSGLLKKYVEYAIIECRESKENLLCCGKPSDCDQKISLRAVRIYFGPDWTQYSNLSI